MEWKQWKKESKRKKRSDVQTQHNTFRFEFFFRGITSIKQGDHHFKVHNERNHNEYALASHANLGKQHNTHYDDENSRKNVHAIKLLDNKRTCTFDTVLPLALLIRCIWTRK